MLKQRDFHKLAIIKKEARGYTTVVSSKRRYKRHDKHKKDLKRSF